jgi:hypothetical protein
MTSSTPTRLRYRGLLIHFSHYDPSWMQRKATEERFDLRTGLKVVDAMADVGMNLLVIDIEDGVVFKSHPELRRRYSVPMAQLETLARAARERGIDVVPKLNFSKSHRHLHDEWLRPHTHPENWLQGRRSYWRTARDVIAEAVRACQPRRFFHIGMDEDHSRSLRQYVEDIERLRRILRAHKLRPVVWNDSCFEGQDVTAEVHGEKSRAAEGRLPKNVVHVLWDYDSAHPAAVRRLVSEGFECWVAPGRSRAKVRAWKRAALRHGATGMLLTRWVKCSRRNAEIILRDLHHLGGLYR